ncbi:hypothetical protein [Tsukamurella pulmonis]|uniref:hypothetical protein n=1 Tax=Tsukamurella pulmonis TaxID=47312 RepID=UPI000B28D801|nr:hypothetical protein [Tsukamurella pulmonis]
MGKLERRKDVAQEAIESTSIRVGRIATIITTAVADVAREIGDAVSDALEMRQAARAAAADEARTESRAPRPVDGAEPSDVAAPTGDAGTAGGPQRAVDPEPGDPGPVDPEPVGEPRSAGESGSAEPEPGEEPGPLTSP